jgi:Flp pilus assembly protein TadD
MVEAIAFLTKQLKFKPRDVRLLMKRAEIADGIGQTVMAMADYESVLAVDPTNYGAMNNLAYLLLTASDETLHDAPRALRLATKANELFPRPHPEALHTLATAQKANGDIDGAIKTIEQAIAVAPERFRERMKELVESYRNQNGKATPK